MAGRIGADVFNLPQGRRSVLIVALQGLAVVGALISKQLPEGLQAGTVLYQAVPVVMTDLMSKVTQQRAVLLVLQQPLLLPANVVGFGNVDRDESVVVTCQDPAAITAGRILQKVKFDAGVVRLLLACHRQPEAQQ